METLSQLHERIKKFAPPSLYFSDSLSTRQSPSLTCKVDENGDLLHFPGNTVVFLLSDWEYERVARIQHDLYAAFEGAKHIFTAQPLKKETFHMTLHDLANPTNDYTVEDTRGHALKVLDQVKKDFPESIDMRLTWVYSMMNTSVLLGLEPKDEDNCRRLLGMYERFHEVVLPGWPKLTPHITLAYYRPMDASDDQLRRLRKFTDDFNREDPQTIFRLETQNLVYQEFDDMNNYHTVTRA